MLSILFQRTGARWFGSEFSELPVFDLGDDQRTRDYRLLAGGLALVLSRCTARVAQRDFPRSLQAMRILKQQLRWSVRPQLSSQLLNDLSHEIASIADAATREAARRCLQRNRRAAPAQRN